MQRNNNLLISAISLWRVRGTKLVNTAKGALVFTSNSTLVGARLYLRTLWNVHTNCQQSEALRLIGQHVRFRTYQIFINATGTVPINCSVQKFPLLVKRNSLLSPNSNDIFCVNMRELKLPFTWLQQSCVFPDSYKNFPASVVVSINNSIPGHFNRYFLV
jgi:hypothetical protein